MFGISMFFFTEINTIIQQGCIKLLLQKKKYFFSIPFQHSRFILEVLQNSELCIKDKLLLVQYLYIFFLILETWLMSTRMHIVIFKLAYITSIYKVKA